MSYLLDTNVVSEWARTRPEPRVVAWLAEVDEDRTFLSVITVAELRRGVERLPKGKRRTLLDAWLADDLLQRFETRILDITTAVAQEWGAISARAERSGRSMAVMDAFRAATARVHGLTLVTRNEADFGAAGVDVFNPWTSHPSSVPGDS